MANWQESVYVKQKEGGGFMITLQEILNLKSNILNDKKVKLVRHKDDREEYRELIKDRYNLLEYQKEQGNNVFKDCDYLAKGA